MKICLCITFTGCLLLAAEPAKDERGKKDLETLQGTWVFDSMQEDSKVKRAGREWTFVAFKGKRMAITFGNGNTLEPQFTLGGTQEPRHIDFTSDQGNRKGKLWGGIYKVEGDTLTLCFSVEPDQKDRPSTFSTPADSGLRLMVLKREKK